VQTQTSNMHPMLRHIICGTSLYGHLSPESQPTSNTDLAAGVSEAGKGQGYAIAYAIPINLVKPQVTFLHMPV
jgi:hypothetical protein